MLNESGWQCITGSQWPSYICETYTHQQCSSPMSSVSQDSLLILSICDTQNAAINTWKHLKTLHGRRFWQGLPMTCIWDVMNLCLDRTMNQTTLVVPAGNCAGSSVCHSWALFVRVTSSAETTLYNEPIKDHTSLGNNNSETSNKVNSHRFNF